MIMRTLFAIFLISTGFYLVLGQTTKHIAMRRILFLIFVGLGFTSIVFQDLWTNLSTSLGVENGTALLTYLVTFSFISYVISSYKWRRKIESKIVVLVRKQAIDDFKKSLKD